MVYLLHVGLIKIISRYLSLEGYSLESLIIVSGITLRPLLGDYEEPKTILNHLLKSPFLSTVVITSSSPLPNTSSPIQTFKNNDYYPSSFSRLVDDSQRGSKGPLSLSLLLRLFFFSYSAMTISWRSRCGIYYFYGRPTIKSSRGSTRRVWRTSWRRGWTHAIKGIIVLLALSLPLHRRKNGTNGPTFGHKSQSQSLNEMIMTPKRLTSVSWSFSAFYWYKEPYLSLCSIIFHLPISANPQTAIGFCTNWICDKSFAIHVTNCVSEWKALQ